MTNQMDHSWISWLSGRDAKVLLLCLVESIMAGIPERTLQDMATGWHRNAQAALTADDWRASVDGYLEVWADARLAAERRK